MDSNGLGKLIPKAVKRRRKRASSEDLSVGKLVSPDAWQILPSHISDATDAYPRTTKVHALTLSCFTGPTTSQGTVDVDADTALGNNSAKMSETAGTSSSLVSYDSESDL
jgi:hypothetical protein